MGMVEYGCEGRAKRTLEENLESRFRGDVELLIGCAVAVIFRL
jgi:hypothetical protein